MDNLARPWFRLRAVWDRTVHACRTSLHSHPRAMGALAIGALVLAAYFPALGGGFVWDDDDNVTNNFTLRSVDGLLRIWSDLLANQQYYPLTHTSFWVEYRLFGLNPFPYHLDNILLHAGVAFLFWRVLRALAIPAAWLAAALFAVHPVHVESVAWITERKNVLAGVLYLAAALAFLRAAGIGVAPAQGQRPLVRPSLWRALALLLFGLALLSKTAARKSGSLLPRAGRLCWSCCCGNDRGVGDGQPLRWSPFSCWERSPAPSQRGSSRPM